MKISVLAAIALLGYAGAAQAGTVTVQATDSIWLAGQAGGATVSGYFGTDTAPGNAPVEIDVTAPMLTFSATGLSSVDGTYFGDPNGTPHYPNQSGFSPDPWSADYNGAASALIGVFLGPTAPTLIASGGFQGPDFVAGPDYTQPGSTGPGSYSPLLNQIFLIGDGAGETFYAPTGATRLFLATADSLGASTGNVGALTVDFAEVPEPAVWSLMLLGFGGLGAALRTRRKLAIATA